MEYIRAREEKEAGRKKAQSAFKMLIGNKADIEPNGITARKIEEFKRKYQTTYKAVSALDN
eukprot:CAMPEP_0168313396 /NCGR_PEP_ID=MMETSP0210-20121227/1762_1 /TAXON_ID=40633 /ORGANISM="Condylostoma magnum, Strain COL2" /LENGTH=60 /DNA_ID=CAMNT_0008269637 /DNA_START=378 /DNA_END=560 /DNA_ORIENTATION=+